MAFAGSSPSRPPSRPGGAAAERPVLAPPPAKDAPARAPFLQRNLGYRVQDRRLFPRRPASEASTLRVALASLTVRTPAAVRVYLVARDAATPGAPPVALAVREFLLTPLRAGDADENCAGALRLSAGGPDGCVFDLTCVQPFPVTWAVELVLEVRAGGAGTSGKAALAGQVPVRGGGRWNGCTGKGAELAAVLRPPGEDYFAPACGLAVDVFPGVAEALEERVAAEAAAAAAAAELEAQAVARRGRAAGAVARDAVACDPEYKYGGRLRTHAERAVGTAAADDADVIEAQTQALALAQAQAAARRRKRELNERVAARLDTAAVSITLEVSKRGDGEAAERRSRVGMDRVFVAPLLQSFSGLFPDAPACTVVRTDSVCPLCLLNCHRPVTLLTHMQVDHSELSMRPVQFPVCGAVEPPSIDHPYRPPVLTSDEDDDGARARPRPRPRQALAVTRYVRAHAAAPSLSHARKGERTVPPNTDPADPAPAWELVFVSPTRYPTWQRAEAEWTAAFRAAVAALPDCPSGGPGCACVTCRRRTPAVDVGDAIHAGSVPNGEQEVGDGCRSDASDLTTVYDAEEEGHGPYRPVYSRRPAWKELGVTPPLAPKPGRKMQLPSARSLAEVVREKELFHMVSLQRITPAHVDEADPDSEEDIDDSWRLQYAEDELRALSDATPKQKALWSLWNQFAFDKFAAAQYGMRYTRYSVELFALRWQRKIKELGLRLEFVAFLRALHVHGCIDGVAILSAVRCVDGEKAVEDCAESAVPKGVDCGGRAAKMETVPQRRGKPGKPKKRK
jgi:hypothetical protein